MGNKITDFIDMDIQLAKDLDAILTHLSFFETRSSPFEIHEGLKKYHSKLDIITIKSLCRVLTIDSQ